MWNTDTYKEYIMTFLWKKNDADLLANLDNLIKMAEARLNRKLDINRREVIVTLTTSVNSVALPDDFQQIIGVSNATCGKFKNATVGQIADLRAANTTGRLLPYYTLSAQTILLAMAADITPSTEEIDLAYRAKLPTLPLATDQNPVASWIVEDYLDLYTYTVLAQTAPFLREDERVPMWLQLSNDAINDVVEEDRFNIDYGGSPLNMPRNTYVP